MQFRSKPYVIMTRQEIADRLIEHQIVRTSLKTPESQGPSRRALLLKAFGDEPDLNKAVQEIDVDEGYALYSALGIDEDDIRKARSKRSVRILHDDIQRLQKRLLDQQKLREAVNYPEIVSKSDQDVREILLETSFRTQLTEELQDEFVHLCARETDILEKSIHLLQKIMSLENEQLMKKQ